MVEAIQCPSCQTRYGLKPARVRTGLRRAQCFRCGDIFHIEREVKRLIAELDPADTANVPLATLAEAISTPPAPALEPHDLALGDLEIPEPAPEPAKEEPPAPALADMAFMSGTASFELPPLPPPPEAEAAPEPAAEIAPEPSGTYASAKDAIARLFGDTPLAPSPTAALRGALSQGREMDAEAGLKALEDTLGGVQESKLSTRPFDASAFLPQEPAAPMAEADLPHAASTVRLNPSEMLAAMAPQAPVAPEMPEMMALPDPPEITQEEVTMVLPPPPPSAPASTDPSALRLRIGDQVYTGLDLPTIAKWIEEGRVLEDHQVARGTSENWMDAAKVPALRAVFDRMRRSRMGGTEPLPIAPPSSITEAAPKRGLFGGMFGKKD